MPVTSRRLPALLLLALAAMLALAGPASLPAGASGSASQLEVAPAGVPLDADGNGKVILAFDGGTIPAGTQQQLASLGVVRAIALPSIGAVAVTAPVAVVDALDGLPGVVAVEPQRRLVSHLYASKQHINAIRLYHPDTY